MGFGEGETCEYCGGKIVEKLVTLHRKVHGNYVLLEDVPAGVCTKCGTHYYSANVLKTIEATIHGRLQADREISLPSIEQRLQKSQRLLKSLDIRTD